MTMDQRVLFEVERWFRALLQGDTKIHDSEICLFEIMAARRNASALDVYFPKRTTISITYEPEVPAERLPVTLQPPAETQREWIRLTLPGGPTFDDDETKWIKPAPETRRPASDDDDVRQLGTDAIPREQGPRR